MGGKVKSPEAIARRRKYTAWWKTQHKDHLVEYSQIYNRAVRHHVSRERYDEMLAEQNGACAICKRPPLADNPLTIDHDHDCCPGIYSCGKCVRGLIHLSCNQAIGLFQDDPTMMRNAAEYLESFQARNSFGVSRSCGTRH